MDKATEVILQAMQEDIAWIKTALGGDAGGRAGVLMDVDRLKRSRATTNRVLWAVLTTGIGLSATAIGATLF